MTLALVQVVRACLGFTELDELCTAAAAVPLPDNDLQQVSIVLSCTRYLMRRVLSAVLMSCEQKTSSCASDGAVCKPSQSLDACKRQARQHLGFEPHALPAEDCCAPATDLLRAAEAACATPAPQIGIESAQGTATRLPQLDVPLMPSTAMDFADVAAADLTPADMHIPALAEAALADQPPGVAALCPPETVARWSAHPALASLAALPSHQQAATAQLLQAVEPRCKPLGGCRLHPSFAMAGSLMTEPAMEQLVLVPVSAALAEGCPHLPTVLADLGFSSEATAPCPAAEPSRVVSLGGLTFEHFTALDLRLDRTQPPTLPLPEDDDNAEAAQHSAGPLCNTIISA